MRPALERMIPQYPYDPARAQQMLTSGRLGAGRRRRAGELEHRASASETEIQTPASAEAEKEMAIVADFWKAVGAQMTLNARPRRHHGPGVRREVSRGPDEQAAGGADRVGAVLPLAERRVARQPLGRAKPTGYSNARVDTLGSGPAHRDAGSTAADPDSGATAPGAARRHADHAALLADGLAPEAVKGVKSINRPGTSQRGISTTGIGSRAGSSRGGDKPPPYEFTGARNGNHVGAATGVAGPGFVDIEHVGPGTPAGNWLRTFWHPIYRSEDVPPGQAKPVRLLGKDFTLFRGEASEDATQSSSTKTQGTEVETQGTEVETQGTEEKRWTE